MTMTIEGLVGEAEAIQLLALEDPTDRAIGPKRLRWLCRSGKLRRVRYNRRVYCFTAAEIRRFIDECDQPQKRG